VLHHRTRFRRAAAAAALSVLFPSLLAVAGERASILPGKRVERRSGQVVTVATVTAPAADLCVAVAAGADLGEVVARHPAGTRFCLDAGTFATQDPIALESGDAVIGEGPTETFVVAAGAPTVFDATHTTSVTIRDLDISGAAGAESCKPKCGRGISGGSELRILRARVHDNETAGIGGTDGPMTIRGSELFRNGSEALQGCCAAGVKSANAFTITGSYIHDNVGVGIWCDVGCSGDFRAIDNVVTSNQRGGIRYETAFGPALIKANRVTANNLVGEAAHGGIEINSSRDVLVTRNTLGGNLVAGIIVGGARSPGTSDVVISNNLLRGDVVAGCQQGVTCAANS
jgi:hypothetical protein